MSLSLPPHCDAKLVYFTLLKAICFETYTKANYQVVIDECGRFRQGMSLFDLRNGVAGPFAK